MAITTKNLIAILLIIILQIKSSNTDNLKTVGVIKYPDNDPDLEYWKTIKFEPPTTEPPINDTKVKDQSTQTDFEKEIDSMVHGSIFPNITGLLIGPGLNGSLPPTTTNNNTDFNISRPLGAICNRTKDILEEFLNPKEIKEIFGKEEKENHFDLGLPDSQETLTTPSFLDVAPPNFRPPQVVYPDWRYWAMAPYMGRQISSLEEPSNRLMQPYDDNDIFLLDRPSSGVINYYDDSYEEVNDLEEVEDDDNWLLKSNELLNEGVFTDEMQYIYDYLKTNQFQM